MIGKSFLRIGSLRLECRRLGPAAKDAPTIVMLHEGLGSTSAWHDFPDRLARVTGLSVFVYSRIGYGHSSPCELPRPLTYMHDEALQTLPRILDAIGFRDGILLGHSDGASIAVIHAGGCRDHRVRGIVLLAPHFFAEDSGIAAINDVKDRFESSDLRERLVKHHGGNVDVAFWGWNDAWLHPEFRRWDIQDYLAGVGVPMLIVQGEQDEYGSNKQIEAAEAKCSAVQTVLLPECGHSPHRDQPHRTLAEIASFSDQVLNARDGERP